MVENRITTDNGASIVFGRDYKTIAKHINNALKEELAGESVVAKFAIPKKYGRKEGVVQMQSVLSVCSYSLEYFVRISSEIVTNGYHG